MPTELYFLEVIYKHRTERSNKSKLFVSDLHSSLSIHYYTFQADGFCFIN